jgi:hypothetical protein
MNIVTYADNQALMAELWPKWRLEPGLAGILHEKWSQLHQDKLRDCIRQHRLEREIKPDVSAIHKAYCKVTGIAYGSDVAEREVSRTRRQAEEAQGPTASELEAWDHWAEHILSTATQAEIDVCFDRLGVNPEHPRLIATMVDYCRKNPVPVYSPVHPTKGNA